ncbi:hypothetical protein K438DRAFT_1833270 [Mycena galopus ATCC 62051]|nr:hypothetical protein K438DRAFT_1833270 [Mycena galopus ATCC 62051]
MQAGQRFTGGCLGVHAVRLSLPSLFCHGMPDRPAFPEQRTRAILYLPRERVEGARNFRAAFAWFYRDRRRCVA